MKIINPNDFYKVLLRTDYNTKCLIGFRNTIKICPICKHLFRYYNGVFCPFCEKDKLMIKNNLLINFHDLFEDSFICLNLLSGKENIFCIDEITYFDNQEEKYFIVNI